MRAIQITPCPHRANDSSAVQIAPDVRPALSNRLAKVLLDKQPAREISEIVEADPFPDVE